MAAVKAYTIGNYFYLEFVDTGVIISDVSKDVEIRLLNSSPATYSFTSDGLGEHEVALSDLQTRGGASYTQTQFENFAVKSTGAGRQAAAPAFGPFGYLLTGDPGNRLDIEFIYDKQPELCDDIIAGSGTASHDAESRDILLAVGDAVDGSSAMMATYPVPYTPGNGQILDITGTLNNSMISGGEVSVVLRSKVSGYVEETEYGQTAWSENTVEDVNWATSQIFTIDFQSLKVGTIRFGMNRSGKAVECHEIHNDNLRSTGYWQQPTLPVFWKVYNDGGYSYTEFGLGDDNNGAFFRFKVAANAAHTARAICATVKSEGGAPLFELPGLPHSADMAQTAKTVSTTLIPLITIRPKALYKDLPNLGLSIPRSLTVQSSNPIRLVIIHNGQISGESWQDVNTDDSHMEYDVSASSISGGHTMDTFYIGSSNNQKISLSQLAQRVPLWRRKDGETGFWSIAAVRTDNNDAKVLVGSTWIEIR